MRTLVAQRVRREEAVEGLVAAIEVALSVALGDRLHEQTAQALLRLPARRERAIALRSAAVGASGAFTI